MKTIITLITVFLIGINVQAQTLFVGPINTYKTKANSATASKMVRMEVIKTEKYQVLDEYDMDEVNQNSEYDSCYSKSCLIEFGKKLNTDYAISGSIDKISAKIIISLKMIDIHSGTMLKTVNDEFDDQEHELQRMIQIMVHKLLEMQFDQELYKRLSFKNEPVNSANFGRVNNSGPRMGLSLAHGKIEEFMTRPEDQGGLDMFPLMSNLGYQFEAQYVGTQNFSALFEFIPSLNGLEQGKFLPSVSILNGFRFGQAGWEFAFGPTFGVKRTTFGFFDTEGVYGDPGIYYRQGDIGNGTAEEIEAEGYFVEEHLDNRGDLKFSTRWVTAFGRTFRSGALNIPVNLYYSSTKGGGLIGLSVGFNITRSKKRINE
ncbi:MAG: hypothetical protein HUJ25_06010 [Crocinitomicaceae bacterium]|nr:hypothetical protein [Crocinitomicaceae bacterium]